MLLHLILALAIVLYVQLRRIARNRAVAKAELLIAQEHRNCMARQTLDLIKWYAPRQTYPFD